MSIRNFFLCVLISMSMSSAVADQWPSRPITFIVPFAAGGGGDNTFRAFKDALAAELKQSIVVQNTVGAGGIIGTQALKESKNDGYTVGMSLASTIGTGQIFNNQLPFDYKTDFEYIGLIGEIPRGVFVAADSPYNSVTDLIDAAKNNAELNFGVSTNSPDHVNAVLFNYATKGKSQPVPYSGNTNTMVVDLLGGRLHAVWQSLPAMSMCLQNRSCKLIALAGDIKHPLYPSVPTFKDVGFSNINAPSYYGVIAPAGLSTSQQEQLNKVLNRVITAPDVVDRLLKMGVIVTAKTLNESRSYHLIAVDTAKQSAKLINNK